MEFAVYGKYVYDKKLTHNTSISIETLAGIKQVRLKIKEHKVQSVCVDMGEPILEASKIPVVSDEEMVKNLTISIEDREFIMTCVSMGNPHAITFAKDLQNIEIEKYGPALEKDSHFPNRTNVEFVEIIDQNHIQIRVWERGSGETLACGTGACAAAVASMLHGYTNRSVTVELLGGHLEINWDKQTNRIEMEGPATTVFEGEFEE